MTPVPSRESLQGWRRAAFTRPHVLLLEGLRGTVGRLSVERTTRQWGWPLAANPADADLVVTCGTVPSGPLARVVEQTPLPRRLLMLDGGTDDVRVPLFAARDALLDDPGDETVPPAHEHEEPWPVLASTAESSGDGDSGSHSNQGDHDDNDHGGHGNGGGHGGHGGHGEGMEMPAGLTMAETAPDRDGLTLDVLHMSLGPLLPWWPGGLQLDLSVQGDVVQAATVRVPPSGTGVHSFWREPWDRAARGQPADAGEAHLIRAAAEFDSAARLLRLAGHERGAALAARRRDVLLTEPGTDPSLAGVSRTIRRDVVLRAMLRGVAPTADGDAWQRLLRWLDDAENDLTSSRRRAGEALDPGIAPHAGDREALLALPHLVTGQDLAAARLTVASLDPDVNAVLAA